jgi:hypothetical protein
MFNANYLIARGENRRKVFHSIIFYRFCKYIVYNSDKDITQMTDRQATDPTSRQRGRPHGQDCNFQ